MMVLVQLFKYIKMTELCNLTWLILWYSSYTSIKYVLKNSQKMLKKVKERTMPIAGERVQDRRNSQFKSFKARDV